MKMENFNLRIKKNIKSLYRLSLILVGIAFYWLFLYSGQNDKVAALDYLKDLDPSEEVKILNELSKYNQYRRKLSILEDLKIDMKGKLTRESFEASSFADVYYTGKDIYVAGREPAVILRLQEDGKWKRENIESKNIVEVNGIWGNDEKGVLAELGGLLLYKELFYDVKETGSGK